MDYPKIYIIVLNYNGWQDTIECLESLLKNNYPRFQIIIVDNGSPNNSMSYIRSWAEGKISYSVTDNKWPTSLSSPPEDKPISYLFYTNQDVVRGAFLDNENEEYKPLIMIKADENRGFAAGNNIGIQYALAKADAKFVFILNNDTVVEKDFLFPLVEKSREDNNFGLIGPKIMHYEHPDNIFSNGGSYSPWTSHVTFLNSGEKDKGQSVSEVSFLSGCAWFFPVRTFENVGLLDENYFMYMEDVDFTQKIFSSGLKLGVASTSKIYHKGAQSSGGGNSDFSVYWISKNLARYILNNLSFLQKITAISYFFYNVIKTLIKSVLKGNKPKTRIELRGFFDGVADHRFSNPSHH